MRDVGVKWVILLLLSLAKLGSVLSFGATGSVLLGELVVGSDDDDSARSCRAGGNGSGLSVSRIVVVDVEDVSC